MVHKFLVVFFAALFVGCAGFDDSNALIQQGNWFAIGERDGVRGLPSRSLSELDKLAQSAGGKNVDVGGYEKGYQDGIERYCDVNNGYDIGLSGMQYLGVCAYKSDGLRFRMEWQRGYDHFNAGDNSF